MNIREIINKIEEDFPKDSAMSFDNSGANVISLDSDVNTIVVCLDVTIDAIEFAKKNDANLIITHHPMIFNEIKNIGDDPVSKRVKLLNKYEINAYSCHTNYDVNIENGMGKNLLKVLFNGFEYEFIDNLETYIINNKKYAIGEIINLKKTEIFDSVFDRIKTNLNLDDNKISYYNFNNEIYKQYEFSTIKDNYTKNSVAETKFDRSNNIDNSLDINDLM